MVYIDKMAELNARAREALEEKALLSDELLRRKSGDPLTLFELFHPQREFVDDILAQKYKECYYIGANRSGKSDAGAYAGAWLARFGYRGTKYEGDVKFVQGKGSGIAVRDFATSGWVSALDFPISRDMIQPKYFDNGFTPPGATH